MIIMLFFAHTSLRHVPRPCIELLRSANLLLCVLAIPACIDKFTDFPTNSNCLSSFVEIRTVFPLASTGVPTTPPCRCHHGSRPVNWNNTCSKRQKGRQRPARKTCTTISFPCSIRNSLPVQNLKNLTTLKQKTVGYRVH